MLRNIPDRVDIEDLELYLDATFEEHHVDLLQPQPYYIITVWPSSTRYHLRRLQNIITGGRTGTLIEMTTISYDEEERAARLADYKNYCPCCRRETCR
jgi:hypothetical protein